MHPEITEAQVMAWLSARAHDMRNRYGAEHGSVSILADTRTGVSVCFGHAGPVCSMAGSFGAVVERMDRDFTAATECGTPPLPAPRRWRRTGRCLPRPERNEAAHWRSSQPGADVTATTISPR